MPSLLLWFLGNNSPFSRVAPALCSPASPILATYAIQLPRRTSQLNGILVLLSSF